MRVPNSRALGLLAQERALVHARAPHAHLPKPHLPAFKRPPMPRFPTARTSLACPCYNSWSAIRRATKKIPLHAQCPVLPNPNRRGLANVCVCVIAFGNLTGANFLGVSGLPAHRPTKLTPMLGTSAAEVVCPSPAPLGARRNATLPFARADSGKARCWFAPACAHAVLLSNTGQSSETVDQISVVCSCSAHACTFQCVAPMSPVVLCKLLSHTFGRPLFHHLGSALVCMSALWHTALFRMRWHVAVPGRCPPNEGLSQATCAQAVRCKLGTRSSRFDSHCPACRAPQLVSCWSQASPCLGCGCAAPVCHCPN